MDIKGLRTLNLVGTILFCLIGFALASVQFYQIFIFTQHFPDSELSICMGLILIWYCIIIIFTILLYNYTVLGLDRGNYGSAKTWTIIGIIVGFAGGIIPLIIFIISYVSFDDAVRTQQFGKPYYGFPPPQFQFGICIGCKRQIPFDSKLCPYCGATQSPMNPQLKPPPQSPKSQKPVSVEKPRQKPLPPPPKRGNKIMK